METRRRCRYRHGYRERNGRRSRALHAVVALYQEINSGVARHGVPNRRFWLERALQAERDFGLHVGEFCLDELRGGEWPVELFAVQRVLAGAVEAVFGGAHGSPGNAVAGTVEAAKRAGEAGGVGEDGVLGDFDIAHHDFTGHRRSQGELAFDFWSGQARGPLVEDEAADSAVELGPDDEDVGDGGVGDPGFGAVDAVACLRFSPPLLASFLRGRTRRWVR